jgi:hypothetical protein
MLSEQTVRNLIKIIAGEYGKELTMKEGSEIANGLVSYFDLLAKIDFENKQDKKIKNDNENILYNEAK